MIKVNFSTNLELQQLWKGPLYVLCCISSIIMTILIHKVGFQKSFSVLINLLNKEEPFFSQGEKEVSS